MSDEERMMANERMALMKLMDSGPTKIPNRRVDENIILATWNIQNFGANKSERAIQYIADIIERFDIVAIQEVKTDLKGLKALQEKLPGHYKILVSDPTGNNERFAFLYDKRTVITTGLVCEIGFTVDPKTHTSFQLHRMPYCASFRAGRFDFVVVDAHVFYGKKKEEEFRAKEITALVDFVISQSKTANAFDQDLFLVGDFNITDRNSAFFKPLKERGFIMPEGLENTGTNLEGTKTYDKIAWVPRKSFSFSGAFGTLPFGNVLFQEAGSRGPKKEISDHRPLWAEFYVNKLTQELTQIINRRP